MREARWQVQHRTSYFYGSPVRDSFNDLRLRPPSNERQSVEFFELIVKPEVPAPQYRDFYGNWVHHFELMQPHTELVVESRIVVQVHPPPQLALEATTAPLSALPELVQTVECFDYLVPSRFVEISPEIWRLAIDATVDTHDTWQAAQALLRFVYSHITYTPASTHVHSALDDVLGRRQGVCQDYAHLMLALCRSIKIPARYVSGYLAVERARATHAWVEIWIPRRGWLPVDPTHNCQTDETYIKIGAGRDYSDVPPVAGSYRGTADHRMEIDVQIDLVKPSESSVSSEARVKSA
jgi:transglutaminase-like putative cysteine protease